jgi:pimeloyl-ACP methyl ester carboxylesterase
MRFGRSGAAHVSAPGPSSGPARRLPRAGRGRTLGPVQNRPFHRASVAGAELRYLRTGTGRPLVLLHTLRTQLEYFDPLVERLDTTRVEIVAVDLPGHGQSTAPSVDYTADYFADSIGGTIALTLAARGNRRIAHVIAVNPYDYGRWSGIRRSSLLANVLFTTMLWPGIGPVVARSGNRQVLRRVLEGGLYDPHALPASLVDEMHTCGSLPGHARAFRSLNQEWRTWIAARAHYAAITLPVTLVYGSDDWSHPSEREANARAIPAARTVSLERCGHFASLEKPGSVAQLIGEAV